ncbi:hypothetical protein DP939_16495 [Spongiactinospora rosea]|uniref:Ribosomal L7/L12-like protein n=2 Tax=Spongiactinospora rosea TaxID=2248750 RepID=A0A366LZ37_9ACTN|nr:hypothetical protein DP939_16495 [Spongiactinospora rosea]
MFIIEHSQEGVECGETSYDHTVAGLGPAELFVISGMLIFAVLVVIGIAAVARAAARNRPPQIPRPLPDVPHDLRSRVRALTDDGRMIHAIKLIREETAMGLKDAKLTAEAIAAGRPVPAPVAHAVSPLAGTLAGRARELKASGRFEQAVHLVRGETGMGQSEATAFVSALEPEADTA